jgi:hypothetical protein
MIISIEGINDSLCKTFCSAAEIVEISGNLFGINLPLHFPDGDPLQLFLKVDDNGGMKLSDLGHTLMHMSYTFDIDLLEKGSRKVQFDNIINRESITEVNGEFLINTSLDRLAVDVLSISQSIISIFELSGWTKENTRSTFYDDVESIIVNSKYGDKVIKDYQLPEMELSDLYPIDYYIPTARASIFIFAIPNKDKAQLTTIILERVKRYKVLFDSILIFENYANIPSGARNRLVNIGNDIITDMGFIEEIVPKIGHKFDLYNN